MRAQFNDRDFEQLSAYMDGQLAPAEQHRLEERLRARPDLQEALDDLRRTRALLRSAPRRRAPRNFTLTPEMVGAQAVRRRRGGFFNNLFPTLSFASAMAALLLVATLVFQMVPGRTPPTATVAEAPGAEDARLTKEGQEAGAAQLEAAPAAPSIMTENPSEAADIASGTSTAVEDAPPVIYWGGGPVIAWGRGGGGGGDGSDLGGMGGGGPYGTGEIIVPPEVVESMQVDNYAAPQAVQPDPSITGSGPILGVAPTDQTGQILEREALNQGLPVEPQAAPIPEEQPAPQPLEADGEQQVFGVPLRLTQIILAVLAVVTGLAAFLLRRRSA